MFWQIVMGSSLLGICALLYVFCLAVTSGILVSLSDRHATRPKVEQATIMMSVGVLAVVLGHTVVVWIWAAAFVHSGALVEMDRSVYFALVTYTTLGYGDITLDSDHRVFGAMAAVSGLLNFGLSTAFLVAILTRLLQSSRLHK